MSPSDLFKPVEKKYDHGTVIYEGEKLTLVPNVQFEIPSPHFPDTYCKCPIGQFWIDYSRFPFRDADKVLVLDPIGIETAVTLLPALSNWKHFLQVYTNFMRSVEL